MKKRLVSVVLVAAFAFSMLAGCGSDNKATTNDNGSAAAENTTSSSDGFNITVNFASNLCYTHINTYIHTPNLHHHHTSDLTGSLAQFLYWLVPKSLFNLKNLTKLLLISNQLSGGIPAAIGSCTSLTRLWLGSNHLTGQFSSEYRVWKIRKSIYNRNSSRDWKLHSARNG